MKSSSDSNKFLPPIIGGLIIIPTFLAQHATAIIVIEKAKYKILRNVRDSLVQWKPPAHILKNIYGYFPDFFVIFFDSWIFFQRKNFFFEYPCPSLSISFLLNSNSNSPYFESKVPFCNDRSLNVNRGPSSANPHRFSFLNIQELHLSVRRPWTYLNWYRCCLKNI